jgi:hypothetical protein
MYNLTDTNKLQDVSVPLLQPFSLFDFQVK